MLSFKNIAKLVRQATDESSTPAKEFHNLLNQSIVMTERERHRPPSKTYKPSSLGGCMRRVYFEITGAPIDPNPDIDPDFVSIAESGTDRHERIQQHIINMQKHGIEVEWVDVEEYLKLYPQPGTRVVERKGYEYKMRNDIFNMSFMCDGIIKFKGEYYILEIKTEASFKWNGRTDAEEKHKVQAAAYSTAFGIDKVMFIYEQRDFCKKKVLVIEITDTDRDEKVIDYIHTVDGYVERKEVPPKTEKKNECRYCPFTKECRKW